MSNFFETSFPLNENETAKLNEQNKMKLQKVGCKEQ